VELLVAISIITVSMLGIFVLLTRAVGLRQVLVEEYIAAYLASEGIEVSRNLFDKSFIDTEASGTAEQNAFYGWTGEGSIAPAGNVGTYQVQYNSSALTPISCTSFFNGGVTEAAVRNALFGISKCNDIDLLNFNEASGVYSYATGDAPTKFKRIIIIDRLDNVGGLNGTAPHQLDYRVTSAVGWETRGGAQFVVHLEDHFLPWRIVSPGGGGASVTWTFCADEFQTCSFSGTKLVRYGSGTTYFTGTFMDSVQCTNGVFGDPTPGVSKHCDYQN
jgi:type II secretory pathway pseudopilin PulG